MVVLRIALAAALALPGTGMAQTPFCAQALRDINFGLRDIEIDTWRGLTDDSAPRASLRLARAAVITNRAAINLQLMRDAKCKMPTTVYSTAPYAEIMSTCLEKSEEKKNGAVGTAVLTCARAVNEAPDSFK